MGRGYMPKAGTVCWGSPPELVEELADEFGPFDLDAAASDEQHVCEHYYTDKEDGLDREWYGRVYMNPPYGLALRAWMAKARAEVEAGRAEIVVCLVPAKTSTAWWHDNVEISRDEGGPEVVRFLRGRLRYTRPWYTSARSRGSICDGLDDVVAPFGSVVIVYRRRRVAQDPPPADPSDGWSVADATRTVGPFVVSGVYIGDAVALTKRLPSRSIDCIVTSPPYWHIRDYGVDGQYGREASLDAYIEQLLVLFRELHRVLKRSGTCWLNLGDGYASSGAIRRGSDVLKPGPRGGAVSYGKRTIGSAPTPKGLKPKDLIGVPWRVALALQGQGWYIRSDVIWHKPNPVPGPWKDRPTTAHEHVFLLSRSRRYYYDEVAVREDSVTAPRINRQDGEGAERRGAYDPVEQWRPDERVSGATRGLRSVWTIPSEKYSGGHYAPFPQRLAEVCIRAGTSEAGCCAECGAPLERVVERVKIQSGGGEYERKHSKGDPGSLHRRMLKNMKAARAAGGRHGNPFPDPLTLGWRPTCRHMCSERVRAVVLDPFMGSGTVARVCERMRRQWIGFDIDHRSVHLVRQRVRRAQCELPIGL